MRRYRFRVRPTILAALLLPSLVFGLAGGGTPEQVPSSAGLPLVCGSLNSWKRVDVVDEQFSDIFNALADVVDLHERKRQGAISREELPYIDQRVIEGNARSAIKFAVDLAGFSCVSCDGDTIDWDRVPEDVSIWKRAAETYAERARAARLTEQQECAHRFIDTRSAELRAIDDSLGQNLPGYEASVEPIPVKLVRVLSARVVVEVSLAPLARATSWTREACQKAQAFAADLRAFVDRGTQETWRSLVGLAEPGSYAAAVAKSVAPVLAQVRARHEALERYTLAFEELLREHSAEGRANLTRDMRSAYVDPEWRLAEPSECASFPVTVDARVAAKVTLCTPSVKLYRDSWLAIESADGLAAWRSKVARFRQALDDTSAMAREGVWVPPPDTN